jgi:hypothetical protein
MDNAICKYKKKISEQEKKLKALQEEVCALTTQGQTAMFLVKILKRKFWEIKY